MCACMGECYVEQLLSRNAVTPAMCVWDVVVEATALGNRKHVADLLLLKLPTSNAPLVALYNALEAAWPLVHVLYTVTIKYWILMHVFFGS